MSLSWSLSPVLSPCSCFGIFFFSSHVVFHQHILSPDIHGACLVLSCHPSRGGEHAFLLHPPPLPQPLTTSSSRQLLPVEGLLSSDCFAHSCEKESPWRELPCHARRSSLY